MRIVVLFVLLSFGLQAQTGRIEQNERLYEIAQRLEILYGNYQGSIGNGALFRSDLYDLGVGVQSFESSNRWRHTIEYIKHELPEFSELEEGGSLLRNIYKNPAYFFSLKKNNWWLGVNPGLNLFSAKQNTDELIVYNTRTAHLKGNIGDKIYFASNVYENQSSFADYQYAFIQKYKSVPGNAFYKNYEFPRIKNTRSLDYLNADGYVGYNVNKFLNVELGHGKHHIGYGDRSLLLSNFSTNYFYLRLNTRFWRFNYQNIFKEIFPFSSEILSGDKYFPKKYAASHYLSYKVNDNIELGLFETVVFARSDHFEFQYLNPLILYRSVEQLLNSSDNVLIGLQGKWNIANRFQLYGQAIIDEFNFNILKGDLKNWSNKWGGQIGLKYINAFGLPFLDLQTELNAVRPFTYTHNRIVDGYDITTANYSHHGQALAHPLGSNFMEWINSFTYLVSPKWSLHGRCVYTRAGFDSDSNFVGQNILLDNSSRKKNSYAFLEGKSFDMLLFRTRLQYEVYHNINIELTGQYRKANSEVEQFDNTNYYLGIGLRMNTFGATQEY